MTKCIQVLQKPGFLIVPISNSDVFVRVMNVTSWAFSSFRLPG
jgi:hypothetical protein